MRVVVFMVAIAFLCAMGALTALDFKNNGVTAAGVVGIVVLVVFGVGIIGALLHPPRR
jgi:hypothetical protein